jgi:hypothetical protein
VSLTFVSWNRIALNQIGWNQIGEWLRRIEANEARRRKHWPSRFPRAILLDTLPNALVECARADDT